MNDVPSASAAWVPWVQRLRVLLSAGLVATWVTGRVGAGAALPVAGALVAGAALLAWRGTVDVRARVLVGVLLADNAVLTWVLATTGGSANPFSTLYLVNISLAAMLTGPWALAAVGITSAAGYGLLFRVVDMESLHGPGAFEDHLWGMWLSFVLSGLLIATSVFLTRRALQRAEAEVAALRDRAARMDRLAALTSLAAGAAHELGTPLSTLRTAAREVRLALEEDTRHAALRPELDAMATAAERCRDILQRLSRGGGTHAGEVAVDMTLEEAWEAARRVLPPTRVDLRVSWPAGARVVVPPRAAAEALKNVVQNACEASPPGGTVEVSAVREGTGWCIHVTDHGPGFPPDILARLGEPFVTGKAEGMGLGLHLADQLCRQLGGRLVVRRDEGKSATTVTTWWPAPRSA